MKPPNIKAQQCAIILFSTVMVQYFPGLGSRPCSQAFPRTRNVARSKNELILLSNFYCVLRCACGGRPGNEARPSPFRLEEYNNYIIIIADHVTYSQSRTWKYNKTQHEHVKGFD